MFRRFCEIQDIPYKKTAMTYDDLRQIVAKYQDLCKCPELKVVNFSYFASLCISGFGFLHFGTYNPL